jgi:hypothetical protein
MADWTTVRFDPGYEEKLDPEITPLCDALNAAGFVTTSSCCGHGHSRPHVWFEHSSDKRIESLARYILVTQSPQNPRHTPIFQKEILLNGYAWDLEIHLHNVYHDTSEPVALRGAEFALAQVTKLVVGWALGQSSSSTSTKALCSL